MDDEETVALIAGGHSFGKTHGAADAEEYVGPEPEAAPVQEMGLGWKNSFGTGDGDDAITSGLEGAWTPTPIQWDNAFFDTLFGHEWKLSKSPAGAHQWIPTDESSYQDVPDPQDPALRHPPVMLTTDLSLREDPDYEPISRKFHQNPDEFAKAFAKAWFKLTHRDMGPIARYLGPLVPVEEEIWQDPVPAVDHPLVDDADVADLKQRVLDSGLSVGQLVATAWASASTFRGSDKRGGANGARIRLQPQKDWDVNSGSPEVLEKLEQIRSDWNAAASGGKQISLADLIVLAGGAAVEQAARAAGASVEVPFHPGRTDASQDQTDVESFEVLEPAADGFVNYNGTVDPRCVEHVLLDRANLLTLSAPEMAVLVGGLRVLGANHGGSDLGVLTGQPGALTNDFFVNLLDMGTQWAPLSEADGTYEGHARESGEPRWQASRVDLVFGSNSQLRAISEVYGCDDGKDKFLADFVAAWVKVMELDRFDLRRP